MSSATGLGDHFDYFFLSDTTDPDVWIAEERAFLALREALGEQARIYYRHRPKNTSRKAGNIADFVTRWGGAYDHMLVLDADSLMTAAFHRVPRRRDGGRSRCRDHPDAAADHQPQHAVRAPAAIRGPDLRAGDRRRPGALDGPGRQLLGPQRHHPDGSLRGPCRPAGPQGQAAIRRPHPEPRFRRGGADPPRRLCGLHAARCSGAATRRARLR